MADHMQFAASNVTGGVVPDSGALDHGGESTRHHQVWVTDFLGK